MYAFRATIMHAQQIDAPQVVVVHFSRFIIHTCSYITYYMLLVLVPLCYRYKTAAVSAERTLRGRSGITGIAN